MAELTIAKMFEVAGETITGLVTSAVSVFSGLWAAGAPGQLACTLGLATMGIGFGCAVFKISKNKKRK